MYFATICKTFFGLYIIEFMHLFYTISAAGNSIYSNALKMHFWLDEWILLLKDARPAVLYSKSCFKSSESKSINHSPVIGLTGCSQRW